MIIDTSAYLGHWPFRKVPAASAVELDQLAQKAGISHMLVASLDALFYKDVMDGNRKLAAELADYQGQTKFIPLAVINPAYPAWQSDLKECIEQLGFAGIELAPVYHNYAVAQAGIPAFLLAESLGVPVRLNCEFENVRQHSHLDPARLINEDDFLALLHAGQASLIVNSALPHLFGPELVRLIKARDNVFFDYFRIDDFATTSLPEALDLLGPEHFCLGTRSPFSYAEPQLVKLHFGVKNETAKKAIKADNIQPYLQDFL